MKENLDLMREAASKMALAQSWYLSSIYFLLENDLLHTAAASGQT